MNESGSAPPGIVSALREFGDGLLASVQDRVALFGLEIAEEKLRLIQTLIWISAAVFTGVLAVTFASLTLVYLFWDSARIAVLAGLAVAYAGGLVAILLAFRRFLARQPGPFAATLEELKEDRACLRKGP